MDVLQTAGSDGARMQPPRSWSQGRRMFASVARRKMLAVALTGLVAFGVGAGLSAVRTPVPKVHDEHSYLLAADTFAEGRLTNPTHPMWQHFETFHVIQQPSYAAKYQPGQGLILALGQAVGGHPIVGAWLALALAAAAVCWMLQGWMPARWALLGGLLIALHSSLQMSWATSYWGGSLPMAGGALMFGALPRIVRRCRASSALLFAFGALILIATRPFEGFVVGVCTSVVLLFWVLAGRVPFAHFLTKFVLPATLLLGAGLAAFGWYNWRVTGDPLRMPYQIHEATYAHCPLFLWQTPGEMPAYRHATMQRFFTGWAIESFNNQQSLLGFLQANVSRSYLLWGFFLGGALSLPLLMLPSMLARPRLRFVWITLAAAFVVEMAVPWTFPHYFAPVVPLLWLVVVEGLRHLRTLPRQGLGWARMAVPAVVVLHVLSLPVVFAKYARWEPEDWAWQRASLVEQLEHTPGEHLVLVRYDADHAGHAEWVYNRADIDGAKIVWAREMGMPRDQELLDYFKDRKVWLLEADAARPELNFYAENR